MQDLLLCVFENSWLDPSENKGCKTQRKSDSLQTHCWVCNPLFYSSWKLALLSVLHLDKDMTKSSGSPGKIIPIHANKNLLRLFRSPLAAISWWVSGSLDWQFFLQRVEMHVENPWITLQHHFFQPDNSQRSEKSLNSVQEPLPLGESRDKTVQHLISCLLCCSWRMVSSLGLSFQCNFAVWLRTRMHETKTKKKFELFFCPKPANHTSWNSEDNWF